ncbi:MAG: CRISPR-associated endonuclease Cas2 [Atopobiaceae bacterium]|nr:CRISPR-associated endonuclease Cas2 [Atopobiaceae bacterium]
MSNRVRYMRLLVFFDLPMDSAVQRRVYAQFRKYLVKNGYIMLQKSVYCKLAIDGKMSGALIAQLRKNCPSEGLVQVLQVTEKQFASMVSLAGGTTSSEVVSHTDGLVIL